MRGEEYILLDDNLEDIFISAARYAIGRRAHIVGTTVGVILPIVSKLSNRALSVILRDINSAPGLGDEKIDKPYWLLLRQRIEREIKERLRDEKNKGSN